MEESCFKASSTLSKSKFKLGNSTSTKTGTKLFWIIGLIVVGKHTTGVMILSPSFSCFANFLDFVAVTIKRLAELPELVNTPCSFPKYLEKSISNFLPCCPKISHPLNNCLTAAVYSFVSKIGPEYETQSFSGSQVSLFCFS